MPLHSDSCGASIAKMSISTFAAYRVRLIAHFRPIVLKVATQIRVELRGDLVAHENWTPDLDCRDMDTELDVLSFYTVVQVYCQVYCGALLGASAPG